MSEHYAKLDSRVRLAEVKVHQAHHALMAMPFHDPYKKLEILWHLAWDTELRDLEDLRPAEGFKHGR